MKEIRTDAEGVPVWQERFAWWVQDFCWEFVEALEDYAKALWFLLTNPIMATVLIIGGVAFAISAMGTWWWWGW